MYARRVSREDVRRYGCHEEQDDLFGTYFASYGEFAKRSYVNSGLMRVFIQPGVHSIPFPYWHQFNLPPSTPTQILTDQSLYQLDLLLAQQSAPKDTAAILVEPVLGEGGYVPAPKEFLEGLREVCDRHGILLIVDEVQAGFGRTGRMFAIEESGVRPDIMIMAKVCFPVWSWILCSADRFLGRDLGMGSRLAVL